MRVFDRMNIRGVILTNASGGINREYQQGALVVLTDHLNLQGQNPLVGPNDDRFGPRFPDMTQADWKPYREIALKASGKCRQDAVSGRLCRACSDRTMKLRRRFVTCAASEPTWWVCPPSLEVIAARHMGMQVLAISCVTNMAAGILDQTISHDEVLETGERVKADFEPCYGRSSLKWQKT